MNQSIIMSLKTYYRHSLIKFYTTSIGEGRLPTNINTFETMNLLTAAWECLSKEILVSCFKKAGISSESQVRSQFDDNDLFKLLDA